jgi:tetratricopeptide (TPR) repeat protein
MGRVSRPVRALCRRLTLVAFVLCFSAAAPAAASSAAELVRAARAHEAAREDDLAVRRYMEALALDPTYEEAYLGLGSLRARRGDLREAERVYSVAIEHVPGLRAARLGRAYVRRALGARAEAVDDLLAGGEDDPAAMRILAGWYGEEGQTPAQLAVWRRIAARAEAMPDAVLLHEARAMIRALLIIVGPADPAAMPGAMPPQVAPAPTSAPAPADDRGLRRFVATLARKGS